VYSVSINAQKIVGKGASTSLTFSFVIRYDALACNITGAELKTKFEVCAARDMQIPSFYSSLSTLGSLCHISIVHANGTAIGNSQNKCVHK
jgi:hypothetical protein